MKTSAHRLQFVNEEELEMPESERAAPAPVADEGLVGVARRHRRKLES